MPSINVIISCDGDGNPLQSTILSLSTLISDRLVRPMVDSIPVIVAAETSDVLMAELQRYCSTAAMISHGWLACDLLGRLVGSGEDGLKVTVLANADSYRTVLDFDGELHLYTVAPPRENSAFSYRGWEPVHGSAMTVYNCDGDEYVMTEYRKSDGLDITEQDLFDEIERLEVDFAQEREPPTKRDEEEVEMICRHMINEWRLARVVDNSHDADLDDDDDDAYAGIELDDDGDGYGPTISVSDELRDAIDLIGKSQARTLESINDIYGSLKMTSGILLKSAERMASTDMAVMRTRRQSARIAWRLRRDVDRLSADIREQKLLLDGLAAKLDARRNAMALMAVLLAITAIIGIVGILY